MVPPTSRREIYAFVTGSRRTLPASTLGAAVAGGRTIPRGELLGYVGVQPAEILRLLPFAQSPRMCVPSAARPLKRPCESSRPATCGAVPEAHGEARVRGRALRVVPCIE